MYSRSTQEEAEGGLGGYLGQTCWTSGVGALNSSSSLLVMGRGTGRQGGMSLAGSTGEGQRQPEHSQGLWNLAFATWLVLAGSCH